MSTLGCPVCCRPDVGRACSGEGQRRMSREGRMVTIQATWQLSASIAGVLATGTVVVSRVGGVAGRLAAFGREFALVVGLFAVYQYCGHYAHFQVTGAVR